VTQNARGPWGTQVWQWDINRIHARNYADNVVELMAGKLNRLSDKTREALKSSPAWGTSWTLAL
jgi:predicted ATPase